MNIEEIKNQDLDRSLQITILADTINNKLAKQLTEFQQHRNLPGYRAGKTPLWLIEKQMGDAVFKQVVEDEFKSVLSQSLKDYDIVGYPIVEQFNPVKNQDITFTLKFEVYPKFEIPDLSNIVIEKPTFVVGEKDIEEEIAEILVNNSTYNEKEGAALLQDAVNLNLEGVLEDGSRFPTKKIENEILDLEKNSFLSSEFHQKIVGSKAGDKLQFDIQYSQDTANSTAGKKVTYTVEINKVLSILRPVFDDQFAKENLYSDSQEWRNELLEKKRKELNTEIDVILSLRLFDKLNEILDFQIPKVLLEMEQRNIAMELEKHKSSDQGLKNKSPEELEQYITNLAFRRIRIGLMLKHYAKLNDINISNEEVEAKLVQIVHQLSPDLVQPALQYYYNNSDHMETITAKAMEDKVVKHMLQNKVNLQEKVYSIEELNKELEQDFLNKSI
jgi:trigger factor